MRSILESDFSFEVPGLARFRVNAFVQNRGAAAVFRTIPSKVLTMEQLGMGKVFEDILNNTTRNLVGVLIVSDTPDDIVVPLTSKNSVHMFDNWDCRFLPITKEIFDDVQENEYDA